MNSPPSNSDATSFESLDPRIQQWIWAQGWTSLRSIQQYAIGPLLRGDQDVILAAATSAGKTEAAFFPLLTRLLQGGEASGFILSISPLKALINDQTQRISALCESLNLPVLGWHGDVAATKKLGFLKDLHGVLIITPESLESLFVNKGTLIPAFANCVQSVVIDELHSFIGTERGKQVQSLLCRLELAAGHKLSRVGLSATLGDKTLAASFLRPEDCNRVLTIDTGSENYELKLVVRGYTNSWKPVFKNNVDTEDTAESNPDNSLKAEEASEDNPPGSAKHAIADYLFRQLRGSNNLVFPNSRSQVEFYADQLRRRSEQENIPNEFWTHHGSLSKEIREEAESALKNGATAASAICTTTLELGIDIGNIRSVVQVGPPPSVASLRQRLGRSGRRAGESAILRCLCIEEKLTPKSPFSDRLRESLVQNIAMVRLLLQSWVEPPHKDAMHVSTLVQQMLSVIAQRGGASAKELWDTLVLSGTFAQMTHGEFTALLRALGAQEIIQQESSGVLLPGTLGEKLINSYEFYSAFTAGEEFRVLAEGRSLGSIPISRPLTVGQRIIFAGRRWRVQKVENQEKIILVSADRGGTPPSFDGLGGRVHDRVRAEMKCVLSESDSIPFLDPVAASMLEEARTWYRFSALGHRRILADGSGVQVLTWRGDWVNDALALLLTARGMETSNEGICLRVSQTTVDQVQTHLEAISEMPTVSISDLKIDPKTAQQEKWDWALPNDLLLRSFASSQLDLDGVRSLVEEILQSDKIRPNIQCENSA